MRVAICQLDEVYVAGSHGGGRLVRGSRVDLDAPVSPGVTYAQALGALVDHFVVEAPPEPSTLRRPARPEKDV